MPTLSIVKHLDVIEDILLCFIPGAVCLAPDSLSFQELKETFGYGVVMTIPASAHALLQVVLVQEVAPVLATELAALIGMHHHRVLGLPTPDGHQERVHRNLAIDA